MGIKEENILDIQGVSKSFPGVKALNKISFTVKKGEVRALSGENGAGKSTLIKILTEYILATAVKFYLKESLLGFIAHTIRKMQVSGLYFRN